MHRMSALCGVGLDPERAQPHASAGSSIGAQRFVVLSATQSGNAALVADLVAERLRALAVGDGRNYVTALIMIEPAVVEARLAERGERYGSFEALAQAESTRELVAEAVAAANAKLSRAEGVKAFRIIPRPLAVTDEAVTPTLKLKRRVVIDTYADLVSEMYPGQTSGRGA